jgi:hypothetical protein
VKSENQVCSLELSKRLEELGVKQESLFCWCGEVGHINLELNAVYDSECNPYYKICSAFTVAELGDILPNWFDSGRREENDYMCRVFEKESDIRHHTFDGTEANARAKMLIYLLENKLMELPNET